MANGSVPLTGGCSRTVFEIPGVKKWDQPDDNPDIEVDLAGLLQGAATFVLKGREFTDADRADGAPQVVIINDVAEQRFFKGEQSDRAGREGEWRP